MHRTHPWGEPRTALPPIPFRLAHQRGLWVLLASLNGAVPPVMFAAYNELEMGGSKARGAPPAGAESMTQFWADSEPLRTQ
jgi:hypothetical protein